MAEHERAVGKLLERRLVAAPGAAVEALRVQPPVDRVGARRCRERQEAVVVATAAERARAVAAKAVASSRKNNTVKRPGCSSGSRCQPRKRSRQAIQRLPS